MATSHSGKAGKGKRRFGKTPDSEITAQGVYTRQILEALIEMGGSARMSDVLSTIFRKMKGQFKAKDKQKIPSGVSVRWMNKAQWERVRLINEGYMRKDMPRGIWEITDAGRRLYKHLDKEDNASTE